MTLQVEYQDAIVSVTIDRPEFDNRLNKDLLEELGELLERLTFDSGEAKVLILKANGEDFSLGRQRSEEEQSISEVQAEFENIQRVNELLRNVPLVTISALHGRAEGAGLSLAGRCDIVITAENARLSFPEIPHGIPPTIVLSHYRYKLPEHLLGDMIFSGREIEGKDAVEFGLAARVVPFSQLSQETNALAKQISEYDAASLKMVKRFLRDSESIPYSQAANFGITQYVLHTFKNK